MGHEAFGTIADVGRGVDAARVGELVVVEPNIPCGACQPCGRGRTSGCERRASLGMNRPGALAELLVVPSAFAWPVEPRAAEDLVCIEPWTVAETAIRRVTGPAPTDALVMGAGAQGALVTLALQRRGIRVTITDLQEARVAFATERLGATATSPDDRHPLRRSSWIPPARQRPSRRPSAGAAWARPSSSSGSTSVRSRWTQRPSCDVSSPCAGSLTYDHPGDFAWAVPLRDLRQPCPQAASSATSTRSLTPSAPLTRAPRRVARPGFRVSSS